MNRERLRHDLAKYLVRIAGNVDVDVDGEVALDEELLAMLCEDLYATSRGQRASRVYGELAGGEADPRVVAQLAEIDTLEPAVRNNDRASVRRVIALARAVAAAVSA